MIYILDQDPKLTAQYLDDKSLDKMIRGIAQVLCNAHYFLSEGDYKMNYTTPIPLSTNKTVWEWADWSRECRANYLFMVELLKSLLDEYCYRFILGCGCHDCDERDKKELKFHDKYSGILKFAKDNVPDFPEGDIILDNTISTLSRPKHLPLVMPEKYITVDDWMIPPQNVHAIILSYRNYYQSKIKRICPNGMCDKDHNVRWTRREIPVWLYIC